MTNQHQQPNQEANSHAASGFFSNPISGVDRLMTMQSAADVLGLPYHKVQRAAARKIIPTYSLGDSKKYVRLRFTK